MFFNIWDDLGLIAGLGVAAYVGYKGGEKNAYQKIESKLRDQEIQLLKEQIEKLKKNSTS